MPWNAGFRSAWVHSMLDGLADAVVVLGVDGRVLTVNEPACRLLQRSREEIEGHLLVELLEKDHPIRSLADAALSREDPLPSRTADLALHGRAVPYLLAAHVLRDGAAGRAVMLTARNVERLAKLGSQLGPLTSNAAHEIRNALNALVIQASLLRVKLGRHAEDEQRHVDLLEQEVQRLHRVVEGFLKFVRPEEMTLESMELATVVHGAVDLVAARAAESGIRVEREVPADLPPVRGSADLLRRALVNLIDNAFDAMPNGGVLRLRAQRVEDGSKLIVEDTGEGIAPADLPKVFNLFHTTKKADGIGLSLVYRILQLHGGEVRIESERGTGTRVTITLPEGSV